MCTTCTVCRTVAGQVNGISLTPFPSNNKTSCHELDHILAPTMTFYKIHVAVWVLFTLHTVAAQNIGGGDTEDSDIRGGTDSARVPGYVASGPGGCGGQLIHRDVVVCYVLGRLLRWVFQMS